MTQKLDVRLNHELLDLRSQIYNTPLAIDRRTMTLLMESDTDELIAELAGFWKIDLSSRDDDIEALLDIRDGIAVIPVYGRLFKGMFCDDYKLIGQQIDAALDSERVESILLNIDSPGGAIDGMFDLAEKIFSARDKKIVCAYANPQATSAAYLIGAATQKIYQSRHAILGSIGVLAIHIDQSAANEKDGYKVTEIASGRHKTDLSPNKPLNRDGRQTLQTQVDMIANDFYAAVAQYRSKLSADQVRDQDAAIFFGKEAIEEKLSDQEAAFEMVLQDMRRRKPLSAPMVGAETEEGQTMSDSEISAAEAEAKTPAVDESGREESVTATTKEASVVDLDAIRAEGANSERDRSQGIAEDCQIAGCPELIGQFLAEGLSRDQVRQKLLGRAVASNGEEVHSHVVPDPKAGSEKKVNLNPGDIYRTRAEVVAAMKDPEPPRFHKEVI